MSDILEVKLIYIFVVIDDDVFRIAKIIKLNYAIQDYFFEN